MKRLFLSFALAALSWTAVSAQNVEVATGQFENNWESLSAWECPEWFKDAKFGIWAHWGPQCAAEDGDWYARGMYYANNGQYAWHTSHFGEPSATNGFKDLCNLWKAENWDPDYLIERYKSVGARYFMTLGNHHDNFDLWDSPYQEWNSVNVGPKKDIVKGWAEACKKYGLPLGVSMHASHAWTWMEISQKFDGNQTKDEGVGQWWEGLDPQELYAQRHTPSQGWENEGTIHSQWAWGNGASTPSEAYKQKFLNRVLQCVNEFDPDMLYFDDTVLPFYYQDDTVGLDILKHYYNHRAAENGGDADVVVMGKILESQHKKAMLWDVERGVPDRPQDEYWQTCTCIGSWHYDVNILNNGNYKSAQQVIDMLVDIISKNGNLLLSVPIRSDGTIDWKEEAVLDGIKAWMDVNSSSIYGTRVWKTFGEGPLAESTKGLNAQGFNESNDYSAQDVRYVVRNDSVFATIMRWPSASEFTFEAFGYASQYYSGKVKNVEMLGYGNVDFALDVDGLTVTLPGTQPNEICPVFVVTFDENSAESLSLSEFIDLYQQKIDDISLQTAYYNTSKWNPDSVAVFQSAIDAAKASQSGTEAAQRKALRALHNAYAQLKANGQNPGGTPNTTGAEDITVATLTEAKGFSRTDDTAGSQRFGAPKYWTVENFNIPQTNSNGTKAGIDGYSGSDCLMLGVWAGEDGATSSDLSNARIYQKVTLQPGLYYFGAAYQQFYNLSSAYVFASTSLCATGDIPQTSIAYDEISDATIDDGNCYGIYFVVEEAADIYLGFQADLTTASAQEFRAEQVKLIYYGSIDYDALCDLVDAGEALLLKAKVNNNTGYYSKAAVEKLRKELDAAADLDENSEAGEVLVAYNQLDAAIQDFLENGKNPGGLPDEAAESEDKTEELLTEVSGFSSANRGSNRYGTPDYWTTENYKISSWSGYRNGIDSYPGYNCLSLGVWDDRGSNTDGDLAHARIYNKVHLQAGRWYFGAAYQTTYNLSDSAFIYAATENVATGEMTQQTLAYYPINAATNTDDGQFYGIFFTLDEEQDVILGFQANLLYGSAEQEFRAKSVKLLYYGETNAAQLQALVANCEDFSATVKVNDNTGYYTQAAYDAFLADIAEAKAVADDADASAAEIEAAYSALNSAYSDFVTNQKNPGGHPETIDANDITEQYLIESKEFSRSEPVTTRFAAPENWTVENFDIPQPNGNGSKQGLDKYTGTDCLMLGVWTGEDGETSSDLSNARIYRTVHLPAGDYYFGANFQSIYNISSAYVFASEAPVDGADMESQTLAYEPLSNMAADGTFYGIYFTLDEEQDVLLGFQADLTEGSGTQEFRVQQVVLYRYGSDTEEVVGISEIADTASEGPAEIYSMTGMRLNRAPQHGLYIVKQGNKARKYYQK